jgi:hypothetical protein
MLGGDVLSGADSARAVNFLLENFPVNCSTPKKIRRRSRVQYHNASRMLIRARTPHETL